jgi:hypothetical protein
MQCELQCHFLADHVGTKLSSLYQLVNFSQIFFPLLSSSPQYLVAAHLLYICCIIQFTVMIISYQVSTVQSFVTLSDPV